MQAGKRKARPNDVSRIHRPANPNTHLGAVSGTNTSAWALCVKTYVSVHSQSLELIHDDGL